VVALANTMIASILLSFSLPGPKPFAILERLS